MKRFLLIISLFIVSSCTTWKRVDKKVLLDTNLPGIWEASLNSEMNIDCGGVISYSITNWYFPFGEWTTSASPSVITKITNDKIVSGPIKSTFTVTKWPVELGGRLTMEVDGKTWVRTKDYSCGGVVP